MVDVIASLVDVIPSTSGEDRNIQSLRTALTHLDAIRALLSSSLVRNDSLAVAKLLWERFVLPTFSSVLSKHYEERDVLRFRKCASDIAVFCCRYGDPAYQKMVLESCVTALETCCYMSSDTEETHTPEGIEVVVYLPVYYAVEISEKNLFSGDELQEFHTTLFRPLIDSICHSSPDVLAFLVTLLLPRVFQLSSPNISEWCLHLWKSLWMLQSGKETPQRSECNWHQRSLVVLCSLVNIFLHPAVLASFDIRLESDFWLLISDSLVLPDALCRKQAFHLLRNALNSEGSTRSKADSPAASGCVFWWDTSDKRYSVAWDDFQLLLTTLEETQAHIIRPVLPRIYTLITACEEKVIHFTWLAVVFERLFRHELAFTATWAVRVCLESSLVQGPFVDQSSWKFVLGPLLQALLSMDLYSRDHGVSEDDHDVPVVAASLKKFFRELVSQLAVDKKVDFLCQLLANFSELSLTSVPMMYMWNAIACVSPCPAWSEAQLANIRHVVLKAFRTHEVLIRAATQCFMLKSIINLTDNHVSWQCVGQMISAFSGTESLVRGSSIWKEVSCWLRQVAQGSLVSGSTLEAWRDWLRQLVTSKLHVSTPSCVTAGTVSSDDLSVIAIARVIALAADSLMLDQTADEATSWISGVLSPLRDVLNGMDSHVYLCRQRASTALDLLYGVLDCMVTSPTAGDYFGCAVVELLADVGSSVVIFLQQRMMAVADDDTISVASILDTHRLLSAIFSLSANSSPLARDRLANVHTACYQGKVLSGCITSLQSTLAACQKESESSMALALQQLSSLHLLAWLCTVHVGDDGRRRQESVRCLSDEGFISLQSFSLSLASQSVVPLRPSVGGAAQMNNDWGRFGAECVECQWHTLLALIRHAVSVQESFPSSQACSAISLAEAAVSALSIVGGRASLPILAALRHLLPLISTSEGPVLVSVVSACWMLLTEQRDHVVARSVIRTVYHPSLLSPDVSDAVADRLHQFTSQVAEVADLSIGLFNLVSEQCCVHWVKLLRGSQLEQEQACKSLQLHCQLWISTIAYGPQRTRNIRLENTASLFVESLGDQCSANLISSRRARDDRLVRVHGFSVLAVLCPLSALHRQLADALMKSLTAFDLSLNNAKMKYSFCSPSHHKKQRLWQALLLLVPMFSKEACTELAEYIYSVLSSEHQPSVKYMCQWTLVLLLHQHASLWHSYLAKFKEIKSHRVPAMCPLLCVAVHMARLLPSPEQQTFALEALPLVMPWCQSQHNTVRAYALACVDSIWTTCQHAGLTDVLERNPIVQSCVNFSKCNWESMRAKQRVCDDFFFATLRPTLDLSLETVFYSVPILTNLVEEEWIPVGIFQSVWPAELFVSELREATWSVKNSVDYGDLCSRKRSEQEALGLDQQDADAASDLKSNSQAGSSDVQQKILRLENLLPSGNDVLRFYRRLREEGRTDRGDLILVTSLLEKVPNIGGLCRTCEIFGVSRLIVSNKRVLDDKRFTALSVTSEKWIPIDEVKPADIKQFISIMRDEWGYSIVGVEQTACSRSLETYSFQKKTLLLLGNEREGIPVDLIQLMDDCVEIPQLGIIRSLNVHVSGAILVWEYTKQQMLNGKSHGQQW